MNVFCTNSFSFFSSSGWTLFPHFFFHLFSRMRMMMKFYAAERRLTNNSCSVWGSGGWRVLTKNLMVWVVQKSSHNGNWLSSFHSDRPTERPCTPTSALSPWWQLTRNETEKKKKKKKKAQSCRFCSAQQRLRTSEVHCFEFLCH